MKIAIPLYPDFTALDAVGPFEVLSRLPGAEVAWLGPEAGPVSTDSGFSVVAEGRWEDVPDPDVLLVPGGYGTRALLGDERILAWIRGAHETSQWTTSVCTGSLLLAAAGVLDGLDATTRWLELDTLAGLGARPTGRRVVEEGKVITAAGSTAKAPPEIVDFVTRLAGRS